MMRQPRGGSLSHLAVTLRLADVGVGLVAMELSLGRIGALRRPSPSMSHEPMLTIENEMSQSLRTSSLVSLVLVHDNRSSQRRQCRQQSCKDNCKAVHQ